MHHIHTLKENFICNSNKIFYLSQKKNDNNKLTRCHVLKIICCALTAIYHKLATLYLTPL